MDKYNIILISDWCWIWAQLAVLLSLLSWLVHSVWLMKVLK